MLKSLIRYLFLDIGGVLLTNGWDHALRQKTADHFKFSAEEVKDRHALIFDTFEIGKITFDQYLQETIFFKPRSFTPEQVKKFIMESAKEHSDMVAFVKEIKETYGLKVATLSNEGKELAIDRIERFQMGEYIDFFIISSFVGLRKPDPTLYQLALNLAQVSPEQCLYIDDRPLLVEIAKGLGFQAIAHESIEKTKAFVYQLLDSSKLLSKSG